MNNHEQVFFKTFLKDLSINAWSVLGRLAWNKLENNKKNNLL